MSIISILTESPLLTHHVLTAAAHRECATLDDYLRTMIRKGPLHQLHLSDWEEVLAVPEGVGELFASRLANVVGVRVPAIRLEAVEPEWSQDFVKSVPGGWAVSTRVPHSTTIYCLGDRCQTLPCRPSFAYELSFVRETYDQYVYRFYEGSLNKECGEDHPDFPVEPSARILRAAEWNSPERIAGHAFRAFLHASHAHTSNCLVDTSVRLWLIDHEKIVHSDGSDIAELSELVRFSPRVMRACARISRLTGADIASALSGIPARFWGATPEAAGDPLQPAVFTEPVGALAYFAARLRAWQDCFVAATVGSYVTTGSPCDGSTTTGQSPPASAAAMTV